MTGLIFAKGRRGTSTASVFAPVAAMGLLVTALAIFANVELNRRQFDRATAGLAESTVETITTALARTVWLDIRQVATDVETIRDGDLASRFDVDWADAVLLRFAWGTHIVKIKIFDRRGRTVYSPARGDIGSPTASPDEVRAGFEGRSTTKIYGARPVEGFAGKRDYGLVVSTYTPIRNSAGAVDAVIEFYLDAASLRATALADMRRQNLLIGGILALIYAATMLVLWAAARARARQNLEIERSAGERLDALESLTRERQRFVDFSEIAAGWVWESGPDHRFTFVSDGILSIGIDPAGRPGMLPSGWDGPNGVDGEQPALRDTMTRREPFRDRIVRIEDPRNVGRWVARSGKPIFDAAGFFKGYRGADRDVTDALAAERMLRLSYQAQSGLLATLEETRARLELALETAAMGWWEIDGATGEQIWSARTRAIWGVAADAPPSYETFLKALEPDDRAGHSDKLALPAGRGVNGYRILAPDGEIRHIRESYIVERAPAGHLARVVATVLDLTDIERLRAEAEQAKSTLDSALDSMEEGFLLCDADDRIVASNRRFRAMLPAAGLSVRAGVRYADLVAETTGQMMEGAPPDEIAARVAWRVAHHRAPSGPIEFVSASGKVLEAVETRSANGFTVSLYRDVTEQRRTETELQRAKAAAEEANRAKTRFLATMSHEVRTPMNGVLGTVELLGETDLDERQRKYVAIAERSASALLAVIDDILDYAKLESGEMRLERVAFDPRETAEQAVALMSAGAEKKGLTLAFTAGAGTPASVEGDPARVRQVLLNLLGNAVKFTERGGIEVALRRAAPDEEGGTLEFSVADTGIGIAPDAMERLFERFRQADDTITRRFGGSGLGLAISRDLARLMGGDLTVESTPGRGTTFRLTVPSHAAVATGAPVAAAPGRPAAGAARALDLLVAEDNEVNRMIVADMLGRLGHRCVFALDGLEAIGKARAHRYDAILMDAQMPVLDGVEATRWIRVMPPPFGSVPIVALTANAMSGDRETYIAAGMDDYVSKPIRLGELARALARATGGAEPSVADAETGAAGTVPVSSEGRRGLRGLADLLAKSADDEVAT